MTSMDQPDQDLQGRTQQSPLASQRAQQQQAANTVANQSKGFSKWFPMGFQEGFSQWWSSIPAATAEHRVLSFIPHLQSPPTHEQTGRVASQPEGATDSLTEADHSQIGRVTTNSENDPYGPRRWQSSMVELSGKNRALNEFSVERVGEQTEQNLVMLHGYGAGLGFFYKNYEALSRAKGWHLYALDMLGMGRSTRPPFKVHSKDRQEAISEAENWFVDALEEWRIKKKIDRFTLLGHSLGGYMAVAYALKYPGRLNKIILASPVGIPEDPYAVTAEVPEESRVTNEFTQDQDETTTSTNRTLSSKATANEQNPPPRRPLPKWLTYLWDANISPFSFVRWSGPLGPRLVSGWTSRRFSHLSAPEARALHDYAYSIFRLRGSGEYALAYILAPGAFARSPLIRRIQGVGRQIINPPPSSTSSLAITDPPKRENGIPVVFMYGEHDWMDVVGGYAAEAKINEEKQRALNDSTPEERKADNGSAKVYIIKKAGHHVYLDGWEEFNEIMRKEMEDVSRKERPRQSQEPN